MREPYYQDGLLELYHGKAHEVAADLPARSVQTIVTSPPYFGLRDYGEDGQIGTEQTPAEFVASLVAVFAALREALADDGTLWINLGDSYYSGKGAATGVDAKNPARRGFARQVDKPGAEWAKPKNLLGIPWRVAFALQDDGWILRSDIIWSKRNFMPEAVKDRVTKSHEYIFMLTKKPKYYYDHEAIREESDPEQEAHNLRYAKEYDAHTARAATTGQPGNNNNVGIHSRPPVSGRNKRSVWTVSTVPFTGAHFATYPPELIRPCILAGSRPGDTVLDPFSGSGTTGQVALQHGRKYIGIDINRDYLDLSLERRFQEAPLDLINLKMEPAADAPMFEVSP